MADLLAAYSFDEASGDALDYSGNGFHIDLGATGTRGTGHTSTAATKSGAGLIPLPSGLLAAVNASTSRTIMAWLKGSGATWYVRCQHSDIDSGGWGILNLSGTDIGIRARNAGGPTQSQLAIPAGGADWYHLAGSYDAGDETLRTFVNGELVDSRSVTAPLRSDADILDMMEWSTGDTLVDDLRFFDGAIVDEAEIAALAAAPVTAAADIEQPIDPAAETDTAQPLGASKARAAGTATETDAALPLGAAKSRAAGTASATEAAQPLAAAKTHAAGTATSTEEARPLGAHKRLALGTAVETDTAQSLARGKARAIGTATESATAGVLGGGKVRALGTAAERDTAVAIQPEPVVTPTVGGNGLQAEEITDRCVSFVQRLAVVEDVQGGDIKHMVASGLRAGIFISDLATVQQMSGLATVSVRLEETIRLYGNVQTEPSDTLDPGMLRAVDAICNAFVRRFTLEDLVCYVDVLGAHGQPLRARPGYLPVQDGECRIVDVIVPLICDDVWILEE